MTKKPDKKERKDNEQPQHKECSNEDCVQCDARRRHELALLNAGVMIREAEKRDSC